MISAHRGGAPRALVRAASLSYRLLQRARPAGEPPKVFVVSYPKSGTHLLRTVLDRLPDMRYSGVHVQGERVGGPVGRSTPLGDRASLAKVARALSGVKDGQYASAHLAFSPALGELLAERGFVTVFMVRDPRDVVVSYSKWAARMPSHHLQRHFGRDGASDAENLMDVIVGLPDRPGAPGLESIGERLAAYAPWLDHADHVCRFERLIGPNGGGTRELQEEEVRRIAEVVGRRVAADALAAGVWSQGSATFRRGQSGEWRETLTDAHAAAYEAVAGEASRRLGY